MSWSPDGQRLAIRLTRSTATAQLDDVGLVNADGSDFVNLTNSPTEPSWGPTWSPDGTHIAFNGAQRLWVVRADGSELRRITSIWTENPFWSPDGSLIAFSSNRCNCNGPGGTAEFDVYAVRPDGSDLHQLTDWAGAEWVGGWSQDGRLLAIGGHPIWIVSRDGEQVSSFEPAAPSGVQLRGVNNWLPDGSFVMNGLAGPNPQTSPQGLFLIAPDGSSSSLLFADSGGAALRPSGQAKAISVLSLEHEWILTGGAHELELRGSLVIGGQPAGDRTLEIGRLGATLPTQVLATASTAPDGTFSIRLGLAGGPVWEAQDFADYWRFGTGYYPGSTTEWATAAFESLEP